LKKLRGGHSILSLKALIYSKPIRYFLVAACGFGIDFIIYAILISFDFSIYLANAFGFCIGAIVNVILIRIFVFTDSRFKLHTDMILTIGVNGVMLGLGMTILWILVELLSINPYFAKLITNATTFILNYITRLIFFRKKSNVF